MNTLGAASLEGGKTESVTTYRALLLLFQTTIFWCSFVGNVLFEQRVFGRGSGVPVRRMANHTDLGYVARDVQYTHGFCRPRLLSRCFGFSKMATFTIHGTLFPHGAHSYDRRGRTGRRRCTHPIRRRRVCPRSQLSL
jgi:hypothetical protein